ncbi:ABC transporter permease [Pseudomonas alliivorans]|nr:ABC transporter permease [Pseudomonas alliivorans]MEE4734330.1 ABC transporter permease [Pseudomonas alliivorans]MEE5053969.1 ABC transporter permease [Pseudomonas alliivorans]MEE5071457.1 ABC transporter permease [Pseudomonas alliivorans]MEE5097251.1 ABC transporter permease [Pseudomonas alliivorans]
MWSQTVNSGIALARRSISIQIKQHALGYAWALITPMLYAACYIFIKSQLSGGGASHSPEGNWDVLRAFAGVTLFQWWMSVIQEMSDFMRKNKGLLRGVNVGPIPFVLAVIFEGGIGLLIRVALILIAIPVLGLSFPSQLSSWFWIMFSLGALLISAVTIGAILAPWSALYADVRKGLSSVSLPVILISPIFYPALEQSFGALFWLNCINPLAAPLAILARSLHDLGSVYMLPLVISTAVLIALLVWSLNLLHRQVPILLERLG